MNLEDVLDSEYGLQQDEWSLSKPRFGKENQLEVVGWSGKRRTTKHYILKCAKCSEDIELFGEGYFRSLRGCIVRGAVPCGCAKNPRWTKEQYDILCSRKAKELGYTFLGFAGELARNKTKIKMLCEKHGEWSSGVINTLIGKNKRGCPVCGIEATAKSKIKSDEEFIISFFSSGGFHPDTKFWKSSRKSNQGGSVYWCMFCPDYEEIGESFSGDLQNGRRSCGCSNQRQQECYVNLVLDGDMVIALKFGVARDSRLRIKQQNAKALYTLEHYNTFVFPSVISCKKAERECLQELECGVISRRDMPDGYTETTWSYNLDKIIEIYEHNGGIKIENAD